MTRIDNLIHGIMVLRSRLSTLEWEIDFEEDLMIRRELKVEWEELNYDMMYLEDRLSELLASE